MHRVQWQVISLGETRSLPVVLDILMVKKVNFRTDAQCHRSRHHQCHLLAGAKPTKVHYRNLQSNVALAELIRKWGSVLDGDQAIFVEQVLCDGVEQRSYLCSAVVLKHKTASRSGR